MPKYRFVSDFSGAVGRFAAGEEVELDPGDALVVNGDVAPVESDWERGEKANAPAAVPELAPEVEVDDLPEDAPEDEVEDKVKRVIHRKPKKG